MSNKNEDFPNCISDLRATGLLAFKELVNVCDENNIKLGELGRVGSVGLSTAELCTRCGLIIAKIQKYNDETNEKIAVKKLDYIHKTKSGRFYSPDSTVIAEEEDIERGLIKTKTVKNKKFEEINLDEDGMSERENWEPGTRKEAPGVAQEIGDICSKCTIS